MISWIISIQQAAFTHANISLTACSLPQSPSGHSPPTYLSLTSTLWSSLTLKYLQRKNITTDCPAKNWWKYIWNLRHDDSNIGACWLMTCQSECNLVKSWQLSVHQEARNGAEGIDILKLKFHWKLLSYNEAEIRKHSTSLNIITNGSTQNCGPIKINHSFFKSLVNCMWKYLWIVIHAIEQMAK